MGFKLLAIDLDGTLLTSQKAVTPATCRILQEALEMGIHVALVSGRTLPSVLQVMEQLALIGPRCWAIACNGALIWSQEKSVMISACVLEHDDILALTQFGRSLNLECYQIEGQQLVASRPVLPDAGALRYCRMPVVSLPSGWESHSRRQTPKMMFIEGRTTIDTLTERISPSLSRRYYFVRSEPNYFEVMQRGVNKGAACQALAAHLAISPEAILAIGDEENDREMLAFAGTGIAMGNAVPKIKAIADWVTTNNDQEGVAIALQRYVLPNASAR
ncbi:Cof-type HAD-IIB family hydrolase [Pectobacterium polonicum]|uniref:Cof-type HAD-IIB family hydrolase n=1 Tax=Pectobacterium polonicum TaxID=2485124 RepID=A0ABV1PG42_9GAMM|nr:Cof-type HAD-IIB family hydrolase [Pectobacterium polonicum]MDC9820498.1 Cof-type HAD-IIB family hydrolase [Pectobacterium polonicum]TKY82470.1 HAD family phosphatase [Pectobacterium polonicum]